MGLLDGLTKLLGSALHGQAPTPMPASLSQRPFVASSANDRPAPQALTKPGLMVNPLMAIHDEVQKQAAFKQLLNHGLGNYDNQAQPMTQQDVVNPNIYDPRSTYMPQLNNQVDPTSVSNPYANTPVDQPHFNGVHGTQWTPRGMLISPQYAPKAPNRYSI